MIREWRTKKKKTWIEGRGDNPDGSHIYWECVPAGERMLVSA